jgi:transposase
MEKTEAHRVPRVVLNERRRLAVKLRLGGATIAETVAQCELGRSAVIRAMQCYKRGGWKSVAVPIVGRPSGSGRQLAAEQEKKIQQLIQDRTPDQLKLSYALWTRQAVNELIEALYGIRLTVRNMGKYLKRWGFTPQRPLKKAYEQSPEAVHQWVNEQYPKIAAQAKKEGAEIQWGDETGLRSDDAEATRRKERHPWCWPTPTARS